MRRFPDHGIATYPTFSDFPSKAENNACAVAYDTKIIYQYDIVTKSWNRLSAVADKPFFSAYKSGNQTGVNPNNSYVKITFDREYFDNLDGWDTSTSVYTAPMSGYYKFQHQYQHATTNSLANTYASALFKNGSIWAIGQGVRLSGTTLSPIMSSDFPLMYLEEGETVEIYIFGNGNNSVNQLTVNGGNLQTTNFSGFML